MMKRMIDSETIYCRSPDWKYLQQNASAFYEQWKEMRIQNFSLSYITWKSKSNSEAM